MTAPHTSIDSDAISDGSMKKYRRQRFMSCPSINDHMSSRIAIAASVPRQHRQSQIDQFSCAHSVYPRLSASSSDSASSADCGDQRASSIGVRAFDSWRPRRNSSRACDADAMQSIAYRATFTLNEECVLDAMNVDTSLVKEAGASPSGGGPAAAASFSAATPPHCYRHTYGASGSDLLNNPFRSDLFLRVLYLIGSAANDGDRGSRNSSGGSDNASAIQQQFLSDEQIRENQLREQLDGVERLRHEMAGGDSSSGRSGNVTPAEFIYQTIPNIIKRNSFANMKVDPEPAPAYVSKHSSDDLVDQCNQLQTAHHTDTINIKSRNSSHKLTGMEKCMLAPLTF